MIKRLKHLCIGCTALLGVAFLFGNELQAQVVEDFEIRFQTQQNGGIQFLANTSLYCGTGSQCVQAQNAMPITGFPQDNNNDHNMVYFNSDDDASTWSSSSDSLSLGICAEISFAGLYWAGRLGNGFVANEALKDQVKIKAANGDAYIDVFAEESIDFRRLQYGQLLLLCRHHRVGLRTTR